MTARDGRVCRLENVFLRGGNIKFVVLPEILKSSPILKKVQTIKAKKGDGEPVIGKRPGSKGVAPAAKKQKKAE